MLEVDSESDAHARRLGGGLLNGVDEDSPKELIADMLEPAFPLTKRVSYYSKRQLYEYCTDDRIMRITIWITAKSEWLPSITRDGLRLLGNLHGFPDY